MVSLAALLAFGRAAEGSCGRAASVVVSLPIPATSMEASEFGAFLGAPLDMEPL